MSTQKTITTVVDPTVSARVGNDTFLSSVRTSLRNSLTVSIILLNIVLYSLTPLVEQASIKTQPPEDAFHPSAKKPSEGRRYERVSYRTTTPLKALIPSGSRLAALRLEQAPI